VALKRDTTKPGLWTLDWTMDWTLDSIMDSIIGLKFQSPRVNVACILISSKAFVCRLQNLLTK